MWHYQHFVANTVATAVPSVNNGESRPEAGSPEASRNQLEILFPR